MGLLFDDALFVSIHAPLGGATSLLNPIAAGETVSIHAPLGGATSSSWAVQCKSMSFQSTRP